MNFIDIAVGVFAVGLVVFAVLYNLRKKRRGESSCGACSGCSAEKEKGTYRD